MQANSPTHGHTPVQLNPQFSGHSQQAQTSYQNYGAPAPVPVQQQLHADLLRWLYQVLLPEYMDPKLTYTHVVESLTEFSSLKVRTKVFTYSDGRPELLLSLYGTLPTVVNNTQYRIPVEVWIPKHYPLEAPFAYVTPTETMVIQPGNHVDTNGRCYHPYISYWRNENPEASLLGMLKILQHVFSQEPPVYARSAVPVSRGVESPHPGPPPSHPGNPTIHVPTPGSSSVPAPPYEHVISASSTPRPPATTSSPNTGPAPPAKPPKPPKYSHETASSSSQGPLPSGAQSEMGTQDLFSSLNPGSTVGDLSQNAMPSESLSSNGPPVPRPPNPEKEMILDQLTQRYNHLINTKVLPEVGTDEEALRKTEHLLNWMDSAIDKEMKDLDMLLSRCDENEKILTDRIVAAKSLVDDLSNNNRSNTNSPPLVDELVCAESIPDNQLYDAVCEDLAIDDTLYALDRALAADRLTLSAYLKHTRALAREQFMSRALSLKIAEAKGIII